MDLKIISEKREKYVYIEAAGQQDLRANIKIAEAAIKECVNSGKERALINVQHMSGSTGPLEDYELAKILDTWVTRNVIKKAALLERPELFESALFLETALHNRGMDLKAFAELKQAEEWIEK